MTINNQCWKPLYCFVFILGPLVCFLFLVSFFKLKRTAFIICMCICMYMYIFSPTPNIYMYIYIIVTIFNAIQKFGVSTFIF